MTSSDLNFHGDKRANNYTSVGPCKMTIKNRELHLLDLVREKTRAGVSNPWGVPQEKQRCSSYYFSTHPKVIFNTVTNLKSNRNIIALSLIYYSKLRTKSSLKFQDNYFSFT